MKFLAFVVFLVASVSARGSGPYLPSGWRPTGPAFILPSEVQKPSENPVAEVILDSSEPSGSNALREYGPPKIQELPKGVLNQGLPDQEIEHNFIQAVPAILAEVKKVDISVDKESNREAKDVVIEEEKGINVQQDQQVALKASENVEANYESDVTTNLSDSVTESLLAIEEKSAFGTTVEVQTVEEEITEKTFTGGIDSKVETEQTEVLLSTEAVRIADLALFDNVPSALFTVNGDTTSNVFKVEKEEPVVNNKEKSLPLTNEQTFTDSVESVTVSHSEIKKAVTNIALKVEEVEKSVESEIKQLEEAAQNIPQILTNLDSQEQTVQISNQGTVDAKILEASGTLDQAPEGFLEYGPPGFSEYGPPKGDQLAREAAQGRSLDLEPVITNEARRRRFSPKFKPSKTAH